MLEHKKGLKELLDRNDIALLILATIVFACGIYYSETSISAIGLTFDITGFLLLWRFGRPSRLKPGGKVVGTEWDVRIDENEKKRFNLAKWISEISVLSIVIGFVLQFLGSIR